jgi:hypothetical protein
MPRSLLLLAAAALLLGGCQSPFRSLPDLPPQCISWHTTPRAAEPLRVAVLPFSAAERVGRSAGELAPAIAAALRELGRHEVVLVGPLEAIKLTPPTLATGTVAVDDLLRIRDATGADAVLVGRIEQFDGFHPVAIGLTAHLISCHDGVVLWTATAHLDGAREEIQRDIEGWYEHQRGEQTAGIGGWKETLASPRLFVRYASDRLVGTILPEED